MAAAVQVSKLRWRYVDQSEAPLTMTEALYLATVGGGEFWQDFGEQVGLFEPAMPLMHWYWMTAIFAACAVLPLRNGWSGMPTGKGALSAKFAQGKKLF